MKKEFVAPEIEVVEFATEDIMEESSVFVPGENETEEGGGL